MADDGTGVAPKVITSGFEFVEFLKDVKWNDDFIVCKHEQCVRIVQQNIGIDNKMFPVSVGRTHVVFHWLRFVILLRSSFFLRRCWDGGIV